jgi:hypothetical protein
VVPSCPSGVGICAGVMARLLPQDLLLEAGSIGCGRASRRPLWGDIGLPRWIGDVALAIGRYHTSHSAIPSQCRRLCATNVPGGWPVLGAVAAAIRGVLGRVLSASSARVRCRARRWVKRGRVDRRVLGESLPGRTTPSRLRSPPRWPPTRGFGWRGRWNTDRRRRSRDGRARRVRLGRSRT